MTTTSFPLPGAPPAVAGGIRRWLATRGVLLAFLQMPVAAVVAGYALGLISFPVASFAVFVSSAAFPSWVSYRITRSDDPDEPVHHLHRHAVGAMVAVTVITIVLIPVLAAADLAYWRLWYDLGADLTGEPARGSWSLVAGLVVYGLVTMCVAMSYYVLVRRRRLLDPALLLGGTVSGLVVYLLAS
jgi:hypothetical protein